MVAAYARIVPLAQAGELDVEQLRDLIYAHVGPGCGIEHVRARAGPQGVDILAFVDSDDPVVAAELLHRLVNELIGISAQLRLWRIF